MGRGSTFIKALIFLTFYLHVSSAAVHSLQYVYTEVRGIDFPEFTTVGQVDGQQFMYYDSKIKTEIPKTEWIKKHMGDDYWETEKQNLRGAQESYSASVNILMQRFNQTTGVHTVQWMYGCELNDEDSTTRGFSQWGYDGEDFISFDLKTVTYTAVIPQAVITKQKWDPKAGYTKNYLENTCIDWLKKYVSCGRETLERKVLPEVSLFHKQSPSPEVVCHATGFFPKEVMITWEKDGQEVHEDVDLRETLPNQDGSFQKRSILKVSAEELQKHKYTCVVQHDSLDKEMPIDVPKGGASGGAPIAIITAVVAALVALVAVVAGIVVWKKKNSGFKPVPPKPFSEGDSSSNNS